MLYEVITQDGHGLKMLQDGGIPVGIITSPYTSFKDMDRLTLDAD